MIWLSVLIGVRMCVPTIWQLESWRRDTQESADFWYDLHCGAGPRRTKGNAND